MFDVAGFRGTRTSKALPRLMGWNSAVLSGQWVWKGSRVTRTSEALPRLMGWNASSGSAVLAVTLGAGCQG